MFRLQEYQEQKRGRSEGLATSILNIWRAVEIAIGASVRSCWEEDVIEQLDHPPGPVGGLTSSARGLFGGMLVTYRW